MTSDLALLDMLTAYQVPAVLTATHRLGILDRLDAPRQLDELARDLGVDPVALDALMEVLRRHGLVRRTPDGLVATDRAAALRADGWLAPVVEKEAFLARAWLDLDRVVRDGQPVLGPWCERLRTEPDVARDFLTALDALADNTGPPLDQLDELRGTVVDVGGGLGAYARRLAAAGARVTLVDLPEVAAWSTARNAEVAAVEVRAVDVLAAPSCGVEEGSQDAALVSHLLHDLDDHDATTVLRHAAAAVRPGGVVVVNEFDGRSGPGSVGPLFDLMMRLETPGLARTAEGVVRLMARAGLGEVRTVAQDGPALVLVGHRP